MAAVYGDFDCLGGLVVGEVPDKIILLLLLIFDAGLSSDRGFLQFVNSTFLLK